MKNTFRTTVFTCVLLALWACDTGVLKLEIPTAEVNFSSGTFEIAQDNDQLQPLIIRASEGNIYTDYYVYVSVEDPEGFIGDVCTIGNECVKIPDHSAGDHIAVYKAKMAQGIIQTAITVRAGVHSGEDRDRILSFAIMDCPQEDTNPEGNLFYTVGTNRTAILTLKSMGQDSDTE